MAHQAVHALGVEDFGDLAVLGVAARGAARCVADGQGADELSKQRDRDAGDRRNRVKGLEKGVELKPMMAAMKTYSKRGKKDGL